MTARAKTAPATRRAARAPRRRSAPALLALALGAVLQGCPFETIEQGQCPPGGTTLTYENFGRPFMDRYCQNCHGSTAIDRAGAPGEFIFDTIEQVQRHRARIFVRSAAGNDSMPPGPSDPPREMRDQLAEWLRCEAPQ